MKKVGHLILAFLWACSSKLPPKPHGTYGDPSVSGALNATFEKTYAETQAIEIYYATNRTKGDLQEPCTDRTFTIFRSDLVSYGTCSINVPKLHAVSVLELAGSDRDNPHRYFIGLANHTMNSEDWLRRLVGTGKDVLIFVHGFNVAFQEAAMRAAQIAYDLKYQGPVVLFSWPAGSSSSLLESAMINRTYELNQINAGKSVQAFMNLIRDLSDRGVRIHAIVHSMGHQVAIPALAEWGKTHEGKPPFSQLFLNAPDIDVQAFKDAIPNLQRASERVTVYCSYGDKAISASESYNQTRRLGACAYLPDVDVINVQEIDAPLLGLGHGYYASRAILTDMFQALLGLDTEKRLFIRKSEPNSPERFFLRP